MADYRVVSCHLNIGTGDAAIHLLLSTPAGNDEEGVDSIVLIDGGLGNHGPEIVRQFFTSDEFRSHFFYHRPNHISLREPASRFDAIVVTHWDSDHAAGLYNLITEDLIREGECIVRKVPLLTNQAFTSYVNGGHLRSTLCYYNGIHEPTTVLYSPYWNTSQSKCTPKPTKTHVPGLGLHESGGQFYVTFEIDFTCEPQPGHDPVEYSATVPALKLGNYSRELIGMDLFSGAQVITAIKAASPVAVWQQMLALEDSDLRPRGRPAMVCIGNDGLVGMEPPPIILQGDQPDDLKTQRPSLSTNSIEKTEKEGNNAASVACMIFWPDRTKIRVSHYFAGDAPDLVEKRIVDWAKSAGSHVNVSAIKLSHHGSKFSTPVSLLDAFKPKAVFASNGMHGRYNHCSWETLFLLLAWTSRMKLNNGVFYSTNMPIYMVKAFMNDEPQVISPGALDSLTANKGFAWKQNVQDVIDIYLANYAKQTPAQIKEAIVDCLSNNWDRFSAIPMEKYCGPFGTPDSMMIQASNQMVRVTFLIQHLDVDSDQHGYLSGASVGEILWEAYDDKFEPQSLKSTILSKMRVKEEAKLNDKTRANLGSPKRRRRPMGMITSPTAFTCLSWGPSSDDTIVGARSSSRFDGGIFDAAYIPNPKAGPVYLVSGDASTTEGTETRKAAVGSNLDLFLGQLYTGAFVLSSAPTATPAQIAHDRSDEMLHWLTDTLGKAEDDKSCSFYSTATLSSDIVSISALEFRTKLAYAYYSGSKAPTSDFFTREVIFSSDNNVNDFDIKDDITVTWPGAPKGNVVDVVGPGQVFCGSLGNEPFGVGASPKVSGKEILAILGFEANGPVSWLAGLSDFTLDTSRGCRNSLWVVPGEKFESTLRLCFQPTDSSPNSDTFSNIVNLIKSAVGIKESPITITRARVVFKKQWTRYGGYTKDAGKSKIEIEPELTIQTELTIKAGGLSLPLGSALIIAPKSFQWILNFGPKENGRTIDELYKFIAALFGTDKPPDLTKFLPAADKIALRRISFSSAPTKNGTSSRKSLQLIMQVTFAETALLCLLNAEFGAGAKPNFSFSGGLFPETRPWKRGSRFSFTSYMPTVESWTRMEVCPVKNKQGQVEDVNGSDVGNLGSVYKASTNDSLQEAPFDFTLVGLQFALTKGEVWFTATIGSPPRKDIVGSPPHEEKPKVPVLRLQAATLELRYDIDQPKQSSVILATSIVMASPRATDVAIWNLDLKYAKSGWELSGGVTGLSGYLIYSLFDGDCNVEMEQLLKNVVLDLNLRYLYNSQGLGSEFTATGQLHLGDLELACTYRHYGRDDELEKPRWEFSASLGAGKQGSSLLKILSSVCGEGLEDLLPSCVKNIDVQPPGDSSLTSLKVVKTKGALLTLIRLQVTNTITIAFYQIQEQRTNIMSEKLPPVKRVLVFSLANLPSVPQIPLIGELPQPVDEIRFLWVSSSNDTVEGLTRKDVEAINGSIDSQAASGQLGSQYPKLSYKDTKEEKKDGDVLLASGFHFCILQNGDTRLDYAFGGNKDNAFPACPDEDREEEIVPAATATAPVNKTVGPVKINGVGIKFDIATERLTLVVDGTLMLGPIEMSLIGFSVSFTLKGVTLLDFGKINPSFSLDGLAVSFQKDPLTVAGMFARVNTDVSDMYIGGAVVGFQPWMFEAGGYYGTTKKKKPNTLVLENGPYSRGSDSIEPRAVVLAADEFKSFLAYVKLSGPIATIGYAEIRGLVGGFGYNTSVTFPTMDNITKFPFLAPPEGKSPSDALTAMLSGGWFSNKEGSNWVAAGLTVLAFELLTASAVVVLEWGSGVKLGIFGLATAEVPKQTAKKFARVQLGLSATVDLDAGILKIDGQLTPASFILDPSCHLTGGFALYSWFGAKNGGNQGDWVFTIGGYHTAYTVPPLHPNPPRLGISWSYDSSINITGGSYFAITPTACMAGGSLRVTLTLGPLYAYLMAYADFLINYRPFTYQASAGITVGVQYTLDLWLVSIPIHVTLGATVFFKGPPLSGTVHVDFYVFGFDVNFGDRSPIIPNAVGLEEFYKLVLQTESKQGTTNAHAIMGSEVGVANEEGTMAEETQPHVISCISGLVPPDARKQSNEADTKWIVRGPVFAFQIMCKFAVANAKVVTEFGDPKYRFEYSIDHNGTKEIFSKPMHLQHELAQSDLTITISPERTPGVAGLHPKTNPAWDTATAGYSNLPNGLWAKYDGDTDPSEPRNDPKKVLEASAPGTRRHLTSITLYAPNAKRSADCISPFDVEKSMRSIAACHVFPKVNNANAAWAAAPQDPTPLGQFQVIKDEWAAKKDMATQVAQFMADMALGGWQWAKAKKGEVRAPGRLMGELEKWCIEAPAVSVA